MSDTDPRLQIHAWLTDKTDPDPRVSRFETTLPGIGSRRCPERVRFRACVVAQLLDGRRPPIVGGTEDISHRGVFVTTPSTLPIDAAVALRIHTIHGVLRVCARVVHQIEGVGFGCRFVELDEDQRIAVSLLVSTKRHPARESLH